MTKKMKDIPLVTSDPFLEFLDPFLEFLVMQSAAAGTKDFSLGGAHFFKSTPVNRGEAPRCPLCSRYVGMLAWLPPYRAELKCYGTRYPDIVFGSTHDILVSELFLSVYQGFGLTGISAFEPVEINKVKSRRRISDKLKSYYVVKLQTRKVAVDFSRSVIEIEGPACPECKLANGFRAVRGFMIDLETCSGEDVFWVKGIPSPIVVSSKFRSVAENQGLVGVCLVPTREFVIDFYGPKGRVLGPSGSELNFCAEGSEEEENQR